MKTSILSFLLFIGSIGLSFSQQPTIKGEINFSVQKGTFEADLILSEIPRIQDYEILINTGMNIRFFRNLGDQFNYNYRRRYDPALAYESFLYSLPDNTGKGKFLPEGIRISYVGSFPVIADTLTASDWGDFKGNIAFNGKTIRADGMQCAWYPILYDLKKDIRYHKVTYDIVLNCVDCETLYLNGNSPVSGTSASFKSDKPTELSLFAGKYEMVNVENSYFLNPDITKGQLLELGKLMAVYKKFYEEKTNIPYTGNFTIIQTTPVSKKNAWFFVTYPSMFNIGHDDWGLKGFFAKEKEERFKSLLAHELGHYYFGSIYEFNSELGDMMTEAFPEYMSLKVSKEFSGEAACKGEIEEKIKKLQDFRAVPFSKVRTNGDYGNRNLYVYEYAPLILTAIEKEIGEEKMWNWIRSILTTHPDFTNYLFLEETLTVVLRDEKKVQDIKERYFESDASLENAVATIRRN